MKTKIKTVKKPLTTYSVGDRVFYLTEYFDISEGIITNISYKFSICDLGNDYDPLKTKDITVSYTIGGYDVDYGVHEGETLFPTWDKAFEQAYKDKTEN
jgi:hypothetical protein